MKFRKRLIVVSCISFVFFASCSKETSQPIPEEPSSEQSSDITNEDNDEGGGNEVSNETYFSLKIDAHHVNFMNSTQENWIIIHDNQGNVLDYKEYSLGDNLSFEKLSTEVPDEFTVTLFAELLFENTNIVYNLQSFPQIEAGSMWILDNTAFEYNNFSRGDFEGNFSFKLKDVLPPHDNRDFFQNFSDKFGFLGSITYSTQVENGQTVFDYDVPLYSESEDILFSKVVDGKELRYHLFEDVNFSDIIEIDEAALNQYDFYLELPNLSYSRIEVNAESDDLNNGYSEFSGYFLYKYPDWNRPTLIRNIGFLNRFSKYRTFISGNTQNFYFEYLKFGEAPRTFNVPTSGTLTPDNLSLFNLTFTTDIPYVRRTSSFTNFDENDPSFSTNWFIHSRENHYPNIGQIPDEILQSYPEIKIGSLNYRGTELFLDFSLSYEKLLEQMENPDLKDSFQSKLSAWFFYQ